MFKQLTNFGYQRTVREAVGFYLAYFLFFILLSVINVLFLTSILKITSSYEIGVKIGAATAVFCSVSLGYLVIWKKSLTSNLSCLLLVLFAGILAIFGGAMLGLLPVSYLTTKK